MDSASYDNNSDQEDSIDNQFDIFGGSNVNPVENRTLIAVTERDAARWFAAHGQSNTNMAQTILSEYKDILGPKQANKVSKAKKAAAIKEWNDLLASSFDVDEMSTENFKQLTKDILSVPHDVMVTVGRALMGDFGEEVSLVGLPPFVAQTLKSLKNDPNCAWDLKGINAYEKVEIPANDLVTDDPENHPQYSHYKFLVGDGVEADYGQDIGLVDDFGNAIQLGGGNTFMGPTKQLVDKTLEQGDVSEKLVKSFKAYKSTLKNISTQENVDKPMVNPRRYAVKDESEVIDKNKDSNVSQQSNKKDIMIRKSKPKKGIDDFGMF